MKWQKRKVVWIARKYYIDTFHALSSLVYDAMWQELRGIPWRIDNIVDELATQRLRQQEPSAQDLAWLVLKQFYDHIVDPETEIDSLIFFERCTQHAVRQHTDLGAVSQAEWELRGWDSWPPGSRHMGLKLLYNFVSRIPAPQHFFFASSYTDGNGHHHAPVEMGMRNIGPFAPRVEEKLKFVDKDGRWCSL